MPRTFVFVMTAIFAMTSHASLGFQDTEGKTSSRQKSEPIAVALYDLDTNTPICITPASKSNVPAYMRTQTQSMTEDLSAFGLPACNAEQESQMQSIASVSMPEEQAKTAAIGYLAVLGYIGVCSLTTSITIGGLASFGPPSEGPAVRAFENFGGNLGEKLPTPLLVTAAALTFTVCIPVAIANGVALNTADVIISKTSDSKK